MVASEIVTMSQVSYAGPGLLSIPFLKVSAIAANVLTVKTYLDVGAITSNNIVADSVRATSIGVGMISADIANLHTTVVQAAEVVANVVQAAEVVANVGVQAPVVATNVVIANVAVVAPSVRATIVVSNIVTANAFVANVSITAPTIRVSNIVSNSVISANVVTATTVGSSTMTAGNFTMTNPEGTLAHRGNDTWVDKGEGFTWSLYESATDMHGDGGMYLVCDLRNTGVFLQNRGGGWEIFSDASLKKNVTPLGNTLTNLCSLNPVTFQWVGAAANATDVSYGFVAQDVAQVFPALVSNSFPGPNANLANTGLLALNYNDFGVLAVKSIQELNARLTALEARVP